MGDYFKVKFRRKGTVETETISRGTVDEDYPGVFDWAGVDSDTECLDLTPYPVVRLFGKRGGREDAIRRHAAEFPRCIVLYSFSWRNGFGSGLVFPKGFDFRWLKVVREVKDASSWSYQDLWAFQDKYSEAGIGPRGVWPKNLPIVDKEHWWLREEGDLYAKWEDVYPRWKSACDLYLELFRRNGIEIPLDKGAVLNMVTDHPAGGVVFVPLYDEVEGIFRLRPGGVLERID